MHDALACVIRLETPADTRAINDLTTRAFRGKPCSDGDEQDLINALRDAGVLTLSLVADAAGLIVGHVAISPAFAADGSDGWYALGPIAVCPTLQRRGIGGRLIKDSMDRLIAMKARGCIVLGDTNYYPRHGFLPRPDLAPKDAPSAHYMIRALNGQTPETVVAFHPIFQMTGTK
jgi:putative acetyltransferase